MGRIERRTLALLLCLTLIGPACTIGRRYVGSEIREDPFENIVVDRSTRGDVLRHFGPPDRILRQTTGDVFIYRFDQRNSTRLSVEESFVTDLELFTWDKVQEKSDRLVVFFDREGVVSAFGFRRGREELEPF